MPVVLVVDDRPDARYVVSRELTSAGLDVRETATGREALRLARLPVDLVVLDIGLLDLSGFEICTRLKADLATRHIPIVFRTAIHDDEEDERRAMACGGDAYLVEPSPPGKLLEIVQRLLVEPRPRAR
jgi:CheY-like chemotaxis protein